MDKAKVLYHDKLVCEASALPLLKVCHISAPQQLRFSEAQWWYLEIKFKVGQETGLKLDPVEVVRDMRYARNQQGAKLFTVDEFLS